VSELVVGNIQLLEVGQELNRGWQVSELVVGDIQYREVGQGLNG